MSELDLAQNFSSDPTLQSITSLDDLVRYFGANEPTLGSINRRVYKNTACGASISVQAPDGTWHHNGEHDWTGTIVAIQLGSIVEGSDAEVDGDVLTLPVEVGVVNQQIAFIESEADYLWREANDEPDEEEDV